MKRLLLRSIMAVAAAAIALSATAEIPSGYYNSLNGKKDAELKTAVYQIIHNISMAGSYDEVYSNLSSTFMKTDLYPNSMRWWDMYSDIPLYAPSFKGLNREHSFPKSWWGGDKNNAYIDLNHLYPSESAANMAKSNYPLGVVDRSSRIDFNNGITTVGYPISGQGGGAKYVFEPDDEYKGDFARTYFYMVTCYQNLTWKYRYMLQQNTYPTLNDWAVTLLLQWARQDPVSQKEIDRNEAVYRVQNNRNPFIDMPALAEYIWGTKKGEAFDVKNAGGDVIPDEPAGDPMLFTPVQDMSLDFGQVAIGKSVTAQLLLRGENLTGDLSLMLFSGDAKMFSLPSSKIATSLVNTADGYWLNITYTPTSLGAHESKVLIFDGGLPGSRGVLLHGECLAKPTLSPCTALEANNITSTTYLANWTTPDDDVDYFVVTRTSYITGSDPVVQELLAEETSLEIEDFDKSDSESYYVQSVRLGYRSEPSNVVFVNHSGISGVSADQPLAVVALEGGVRFLCSSPQTGARIFDATGALIKVIDVVTNNTDVDLPLGVYFIITDQSHRPQKVAVR